MPSVTPFILHFHFHASRRLICHIALIFLFRDFIFQRVSLPSSFLACSFIGEMPAPSMFSFMSCLSQEPLPSFFPFHSCSSLSSFLCCSSLLRFCRQDAPAAPAFTCYCSFHLSSPFHFRHQGTPFRPHRGPIVSRLSFSFLSFRLPCRLSILAFCSPLFLSSPPPLRDLLPLLLLQSSSLFLQTFLSHLSRFSSSARHSPGFPPPPSVSFISRRPRQPTLPAISPGRFMALPSSPFFHLLFISYIAVMPPRATASEICRASGVAAVCHYFRAAS